MLVIANEVKSYYNAKKIMYDQQEGTSSINLVKHQLVSLLPFHSTFILLTISKITVRQWQQVIKD